MLWGEGGRMVECGGNCGQDGSTGEIPPTGSRDRKY